MNKILLLFAGLLALAGTAARGQEGQLILEPPLGQAFPLDVTAAGVRVPYPVLLNDHTVLSPNAVLRFIYLDSSGGTRSHKDGGSGLDGFRTHVGPAGQLGQDAPSKPQSIEPAGGWGSNDSSDVVGIFDDAKKEDAKRNKAEMQTEVWVDKDMFVEALDHAAEAGTTLVYSLPAEKRTLTAMIDLPEGMLLAQVGGHVRVLGLTQESRAYAGGIRAGDEIRAFGDGVPLVSLEDFMRAYTVTKRQARLSGNPSYALSIWRAAAGQVESVRVAAPPSIPKFF